jgi:hypothetical protein
VNDTIDLEAERVAILEGIAAMRSGDGRPFEEFDAEIRKEFGFPVR